MNNSRTGKKRKLSEHTIENVSKKIRKNTSALDICLSCGQYSRNIPLEHICVGHVDIEKIQQCIEILSNVTRLTAEKTSVLVELPPEPPSMPQALSSAPPPPPPPPPPVQLPILLSSPKVKNVKVQGHAEKNHTTRQRKMIFIRN